MHAHDLLKLKQTKTKTCAGRDATRRQWVFLCHVSGLNLRQTQTQWGRSAERKRSWVERSEVKGLSAKISPSCLRSRAICPPHPELPVRLSLSERRLWADKRVQGCWHATPIWNQVACFTAACERSADWKLCGYEVNLMIRSDKMSFAKAINASVFKDRFAFCAQSVKVVQTAITPPVYAAH